MSEHTKEPWPEPVSDEWGGWEKSSSLSLGLLGLADYRRARACVNALEGIPTELIEEGGFAAVPVATHREVKTQRDELLAALKDAREYVAQVLSERKAAYAGYPHKWRIEQDDLYRIDALIARMEEGK